MTELQTLKVVEELKTRLASLDSKFDQFETQLGGLIKVGVEEFPKIKAEVEADITDLKAKADNAVSEVKRGYFSMLGSQIFLGILVFIFLVIALILIKRVEKKQDQCCR